MTATSNYLPYLHAFRGFAILNIVGAHVWSFLIFWSGTLDTFGLKTLFYSTEMLFHGSTIYFAVLSGVLFQQVLIRKTWRQFYRSKVTNVVFPYCVMTLFLGFFYAVRFADEAVFSSIESALGYFFRNLFFGSADIQLWYVPVLMVLFVLTPLLSAIVIRAPWLAFVITLVPLVVSRSTFPNFLTVQAVVYFIGCYTLGLLLGQYWEMFLAAVQRYWRWLLLLACVTSLYLFVLYWMEYQANGWSLRQSLVYIQKIAIFALVVLLFKHNGEALPKWLSLIGSYAFPIYFLHVVFVGTLIMWWMPVLQSERQGMVFLTIGVMNYVLAIASCILVAAGLRALAGRYSRCLCGA